MQYFIIVLFLAILESCTCEHGVVVENVERIIDLRSHKIESKYKIILRNGQSHALDSFEMVFHAELCDKIYYISGFHDESAVEIKKHAHLNNGQYCDVKTCAETKSKNNFCFYELKFKKPMNPDTKRELNMVIIFAGRFEPDPPTALQNQPHTFLFYDDFYYLSIYPVMRQKTEFKIKKSWLKDYSKQISTGISLKNSDTGITVEINTEQAPFTSKIFYVRFIYPEPIIKFENFFKRIQVSEFGFISILNRFWLKNDAAALDKEFSRLIDQNYKDPHALYEWKMQIPAESQNIYYRDGLGNVSTSSTERDSDDLVLTLQPRFPIFGGWKTYYYVSYILPPQDTLFLRMDKTNNYGNIQRKLSITLIGNPMQDFIIEKGIVIIRLPEGATDVKIESKTYNVKNMARKTEFSYLDFIGRPVLEFELTRNVAENDAKIDIYYSYNNVLLLRKPLLISLTIFIILISLMFLLRVEKPVISSIESKIEESIEESVGLVREIEKSLRKGFDSKLEAISAYKIDKNINVLRSALVKIGGKLEKSEKEMMEAMKRLVDLDNKYLETQVHFKSKHKERSDLVDEYEDLSKKVVDGKITREFYAQNSRTIEDKIQDAHSTIQNIVLTL